MNRLPTLIDTHCHLDYDFSPKSEADLVREAKEAGIIALITIGVDYTNFEKVAAISDRYPEVYHTIGVHPHEGVTWDSTGADRIRNGAKHPKCVGIGEIGIDFHYNHSSKDLQITALEEQLSLAVEVRKPVVIHSREGEDELLNSLKSYASRQSGSIVPGVIHCFSGTQAFGQACIDLGFFVSFSGILTFKNAESLRLAAQSFPLDRLVVETDSPYLAPIPHRGRKCEPTMVRLTAQKLAEVRGISLEEVAEATTRNARRLFQLS